MSPKNVYKNEKKRHSMEEETFLVQCPEKHSTNVIDFSLLHCPFTWQPFFDLAKFKRKEVNLDPEERDFEWDKFVETVFHCYELSVLKGDKRALKFIKEGACTKVLEKMKQSNNHYVAQYLVGLEHIALNCKAYLYTKVGDKDKVEPIYNQLVMFTALNDLQKAAVWGTRAMFYLKHQTLETAEAALQSAKVAIEYDPSQGLWCMVHSKCLNRISKIRQENITIDEEQSLQTAIALTSDPSYMLHAAEVFNLGARHLKENDFVNRRQAYETRNRLRERSAKLYSEALRIAGDKVYVNIKCLLGYTQMSPRYRSPFFPVESCVNAVVTKASHNPDANFALGKYWEYIQRDYATSQQCYEVALQQGSVKAGIALIKLKTKCDEGYDPTIDFRKLSAIQTNIFEEIQILSQLGSFHFFALNSLLDALPFWIKATQLYPNWHALKVHYSWFSGLDTPANIYSLMGEHSQQLLGENKTTKMKERRLLLEAIKISKRIYPSKGFENHSKNNTGISSVERTLKGRNIKKGNLIKGSVISYKDLCPSADIENDLTKEFTKSLDLVEDCLQGRNVKKQAWKKRKEFL